MSDTPLTDEAEELYGVWRALIRNPNVAPEVRQRGYENPTPDGWETARAMEKALIALLMLKEFRNMKIEDVIEGKVRSASETDSQA